MGDERVRGGWAVEHDTGRLKGVESYEFEGGDTNGVMVRLYDFRDGKEVEIAQLIAKMDKEKVQVWDTIVPTKDGGTRKDECRDGKDKFGRRTIFCRVETVAGGRIGEQCVEGYD